jgi:hypothetical protein
MRTKIHFLLAIAALPVIGNGAEGSVGASTSPGTPSPAAQPSATAQAPGTTTPVPGATSNSAINHMQGGINRNGDRDVNGEGRGVYQNGYYYRYGTYGYNTNDETHSGYANTNSFYWTTNPPEPGDNQRNTTQVPGNALPAPITLPSASPGGSSQPPPVNSTPPPANSTPPPANSTPPPVNSTPPQA